MGSGFGLKLLPTRPEKEVGGFLEEEEKKTSSVTAQQHALNKKGGENPGVQASKLGFKSESAV